MYDYMRLEGSVTITKLYVITSLYSIVFIYTYLVIIYLLLK